MEFSKYKSIILPQAEQDIDETLNYISNELCSPQSAKNLFNNILNVIEQISLFPHSMPTIKSKKIPNCEQYRWTSVKNFLLFYKIVEEDKEIRIMAFLYGKSNIIARLSKKL